MRILLVGHGRMGRLVESLAPMYGCEIAGIVKSQLGEASELGQFGPVDVAIDFSVPSAVPRHFPQLAAWKLNVVIGTTGWQEHEADMRAAAEQAGIGVLTSPNFALGMHIFQRVVEDAARRFAPLPDVGAFIHEAHHAAKKDAPSGTAILLKAALTREGYDRPIDVSSTRAGWIPGTHTVGFDAAAESVTLTHTVRDRAVFARGALEAAKWLKGRRGWFTLRDMLP